MSDSFDIQLVNAQEQRPRGVTPSYGELYFGSRKLPQGFILFTPNFGKRTRQDHWETKLEKYGPTGCSEAGQKARTAARATETANRTHCRRGHAYAEHGATYKSKSKSGIQKMCKRCASITYQARKGKKS